MFEIGQEVLYEEDLDIINEYDFGEQGGYLELAGRIGKVVAIYGDLIGVDFETYLDELHNLRGNIPRSTGLWVTPELLHHVKINIKSYEEML